jgi:hypothetical protein
VPTVADFSPTYHPIFVQNVHEVSRNNLLIPLQKWTLYISQVCHYELTKPEIVFSEKPVENIIIEAKVTETIPAESEEIQKDLTKCFSCKVRI